MIMVMVHLTSIQNSKNIKIFAILHSKKSPTPGERNLVGFDFEEEVASVLLIFMKALVKLFTGNCHDDDHGSSYFYSK
jgi:hypothetical protein